ICRRELSRLKVELELLQVGVKPRALVPELRFLTGIFGIALHRPITGDFIAHAGQQSRVEGFGLESGFFCGPATQKPSAEPKSYEERDEWQHPNHKTESLRRRRQQNPFAVLGYKI